jgi:hypothetical protein
MDPIAQRMVVMYATGAVIAGISAWMHVNGKDGSGWGIVAFFLIVGGCSQSPI